MSLREIVLRWHRLAPSLLDPKALAEPALVKTARALALSSSAVAQAPTMESVEELAGRLRVAIDAGSFQGISERDWSRAAFALWHGDPPLAAIPQFLEPYLTRLERRRKRRDVSLLISAYLRTFSPGLPSIGTVAGVLGRLAADWPWPWAVRHREYHLFDPARGPIALADACLAEDEPHRVLVRLGLEHLEGQGLALAAQLRAVQQLERELAAGRDPGVRLARLLRWTVHESGVAPKLRGPLADALLRPWLARPVPEPLQKRIQEFLLQHYGDPRIRPQRWTAVSDDARQVFRKWLARVALAQFLDVIDRLALDRQWKYRRAFWTAYFDRDWVWDAHVAFGPGGISLARAIFGREAPFAELKSGGSRSIEHGHAVLLMRLGTLTIADWSHNGQCVVWRERNRYKPSLQKSLYTSDDVHWSTGDESWRHAGAASYAWQRRVCEFIGKETGLRLNERDFWIK